MLHIKLFLKRGLLQNELIFLQEEQIFSFFIYLFILFIYLYFFLFYFILFLFLFFFFCKPVSRRDKKMIRVGAPWQWTQSP